MTFKLAPTQHYVIDFDKVKTLDDMKRILSAMNLSLSIGDENVESIRDLVRLEDYDIDRMD